MAHCSDTSVSSLAKRRRYNVQLEQISSADHLALCSPETPSWLMSTPPHEVYDLGQQQESSWTEPYLGAKIDGSHIIDGDGSWSQCLALIEDLPDNGSQTTSSSPAKFPDSRPGTNVPDHLVLKSSARKRHLNNSGVVRSRKTGEVFKARQMASCWRCRKYKKPVS